MKRKKTKSGLNCGTKSENKCKNGNRKGSRPDARHRGEKGKPVSDGNSGGVFRQLSGDSNQAC
ncbi:hypothetical protein L195_g037148 [Trifolium pratense]|uniref:Uncharacterized protein n=1 Tax=Trifolium pratense TaxID=57577 RepID=A0A2K3LRH3_TRIPR|nr:hypothetical protein L195_g037148 [Trifolium pratense]